MAYYFEPLEYEPFEYTRATTPRYDSSSGGYHVGHNYPGASEGYIQNIKPWQQEQAQKESTAFQGYAGNQFQSLFDTINEYGTNPILTGEKFTNVPQYAPYQGTRSDFTSGGQGQTPSVFDQQAYIDARFGNINDYLGRMGSFFGNMGPQQPQSIQQILANAPSQGPRPPMPSVGSNLNLGGGAGIGTTFPSFGVGASGGWGTPPTSLFGAGANATIP